jgi:mannose-6-phosphate isomerase
MVSGLEQAVAHSARWLRSEALPLWSTRGFDAARGAFEEQLDFAGDPVLRVPRRVMVQARQIASFAAAALSGCYPEGRALALTAGHALCRHYHAVDGAAGWVFSVDREGRVVDGRRDLYAHAFVLFALAWLLRLDRDRVFEEGAQATLDFIDRQLADAEHGGYWDCLPRPDALRRQNPHMHLFEALLALFETTGRDDLLERCRALRDLAVTRFLDPATGALRECFDESWRVVPAPGQGSVEPGHLFEWAWLLRRYEAVGGGDQRASVEALIALAMTAGLDRDSGRIVDEIGEDGQVRRASSRAWPHAEALKALASEAGRGDRRQEVAITAILERLMTAHCRPGGGWVDHLDADDRPISRVMPASTLYHLYFGLTAVEDWLAGRSATVP